MMPDLPFNSDPNPPSPSPNVASLRSRFEQVVGIDLPSSGSLTRPHRPHRPPIPTKPKPNLASIGSLVTQHTHPEPSIAGHLAPPAPPSSHDHFSPTEIPALGTLSLTSPIQIRVDSPHKTNSSAPPPDPVQSRSRPPPPPPSRRSVSPNVPPPNSAQIESSSQPYQTALPGNFLEPQSDFRSGPPPPSPRRSFRVVPTPSGNHPPNHDHPSLQQGHAPVRPPVNRAGKPNIFLARRSSSQTRGGSDTRSAPIRAQLTGPPGRSGASNDFFNSVAVSDESDDEVSSSRHSRWSHRLGSKTHGKIERLTGGSWAHGIPKRTAGLLPITKHTTGPTPVIQSPPWLTRPAPPPLPHRQLPDRHPPEVNRSIKSVSHTPPRPDEFVKPNEVGHGDGPKIHSNIREMESTYPNIQESSRRAPLVWEFQHEARFGVAAFCGSSICITGDYTCVWERQGDVYISKIALKHEDGSGRITMTALAFKPTREVADSESHVWLGSSQGRLYELNVINGKFSVIRNPTGPQAPIVAIYCMGSEMWSIDGNGKVDVWQSDQTGSPSLSIEPFTFHLPKDSTFTLPLGEELWYAVGSQIWVYRSDTRARREILVTSQPLKSDINSKIIGGCVLSRDVHSVYFSHANGCISIFDKSTYTFKYSVQISLHGVPFMAGVGDFLWVALNTGNLRVYDTQTSPWKLVKCWDAHSHPFRGMLADRMGAWKDRRLQVVTHDSKRFVKVWDGFLRTDYINWEMTRLASSYSSFQTLSLLVVTWNTGAASPDKLQKYNFFQELTSDSPNALPDILVFSFQEVVDLESKSEAARTLLRGNREGMGHSPRRWQALLLTQYCNTLHNPQYDYLESCDLVGLYSCVFVKKNWARRVSLVQVAERKLGFGGQYGNKGALAIRFLIDDTSICLVNCHLAAGQADKEARNQNIANIISHINFNPVQYPLSAVNFTSGGDGSQILDHEIAILSGDMNYRIDSSTRDTLIRQIEHGQLDKFRYRDQLLSTRKKVPDFVLRAFAEAPLRFDPTYKYDVGTDTYDSSEKRRLPAWCDRVLSRSCPEGRVKQLHYRRYEVKESDHRPVSALFELTVKKVDPVEWEKVRDRVAKEYDSRTYQRIVRSVCLDYLTNVMGVDYDTAVKSVEAAPK